MSYHEDRKFHFYALNRHSKISSYGFVAWKCVAKWISRGEDLL